MSKEPIGSFRNKMPYGSVLRFSGKGVFVRIQMLSVLAFSAAASADSLVVGLSYGLRKIKVDWKSNLVVALLSLAGTVCSMILGRMLLPVLPDRFENVLGGGIIMGIGLFSLLRPWFSQKGKDGRERVPRALTLKSTLLLGAALAVNNIGLGVGASITGMRLVPTAACAFLCSLLFFFGGNWIGGLREGGTIGWLAEPVANLLMVGLGIFEILV